MMPEDGHAHLVEQVDRSARIDQRQVLRRRDDHRSGRPRALDQRELDVAGARRQVDDQQLAIAPVGFHQLGQRAGRHRPAPGQRVPRRDQLPKRQEPDPVRLDRDQLLALGGRLGIGAERASAATGRRRRRRSARPSCPSAPARSRGSPRRWICRRRLCRCRWRSASATAPPRSSRCGLRPRRRSTSDGRRAAPARSSLRSAAESPVASTMIVATPPASLRRANPLVMRKVGQRFGVGHERHIGTRVAACHCFSCGPLPIIVADEQFIGVGRPRSRPVHRHQRSVGRGRRRTTMPSGDDHGGGPWGEPPRAAARAGGRRLRRSTISFAGAGCASAAAADFRGVPTDR